MQELHATDPLMLDGAAATGNWLALGGTWRAGASAAFLWPLRATSAPARSSPPRPTALGDAP